MGEASGVKYPLVEEFYSIQGEGFYSGTAAYFIRLAGCDVGCSWCDAKESWVEKKHPLVEVEKLVQNVISAGAKYCVITGGEPLLHNIEPLTSTLRKLGITTMVETSGTQPISGVVDWVCVSPKKHKKPLDEMLQEADELKVVIGCPEDLEWAEECARKVAPGTLLYLQPEWSAEGEIMPHIVEHAKRAPKWKISIQTHKYMQIP